MYALHATHPSNPHPTLPTPNPAGGVSPSAAAALAEADGEFLDAVRRHFFFGWCFAADGFAADGVLLLLQMRMHALSCRQQKSCAAALQVSRRTSVDDATAAAQAAPGVGKVGRDGWVGACTALVFALSLSHTEDMPRTSPLSIVPWHPRAG